MVEEGATLRGTDVEAQPVAQRDENGGSGRRKSEAAIGRRALRCEGFATER